MQTGSSVKGRFPFISFRYTYLLLYMDLCGIYSYNSHLYGHWLGVLMVQSELYYNIFV